MRTVFGRDDEAKLVAVTGTAFEERFAVGDIVVSSIERAAFTLPRGAVALEIAQVRGSALRPLPRQLHDACLHDDAARTNSGKTIGRTEHPAHARSATDPAAIEMPAARSRRSRRAARQIGGLAKLVCERAIRADPPQP